jgi:hypothetical protein
LVQGPLKSYQAKTLPLVTSPVGHHRFGGEVSRSMTLCDLGEDLQVLTASLWVLSINPRTFGVITSNPLALWVPSINPRALWVITANPLEHDCAVDVTARDVAGWLSPLW